MVFLYSFFVERFSVFLFLAGVWGFLVGIFWCVLVCVHVCVSEYLPLKQFVFQIHGLLHTVTFAYRFSHH